MIIAHWELPQVLQTAKENKKLLFRWTHTAKAFGVRDVVMIDVDGIEPFFNDAEINFTVVPTLDAALELVGDREPVYVEQGGADMNDFFYPEHPAFIFGSDYSPLTRADVSIPTEQGLHCDIACGIILSQWRMRWP